MFENPGCVVRAVHACATRRCYVKLWPQAVDGVRPRGKVGGGGVEAARIVMVGMVGVGLRLYLDVFVVFRVCVRPLALQCFVAVVRVCAQNVGVVVCYMLPAPLLCPNDVDATCVSRTIECFNPSPLDSSRKRKTWFY